MRDWPTREHPTGERCEVVETAYEAFGSDAQMMLYEYTCFPFSDDEAWDQLMDILCARGIGKLPEYLRAVHNHQVQRMREAANRG